MYLSPLVTYIHDPSVINILLVGRSQVGKSTLIESLKDSAYSSSRTGISQTREPSYKQLTLTSNDDGQQYTLNIIDTPGLREIRHDPNETSSDEQLLDLMRKLFDDGRVRSLNIIAFVSKMGYTHQNDIDTFKSLIDFFGPQFSSISVLILTHCDKIPNDAMKKLTHELKTHPECAEVVKYFKLGVHYHGTLDVDDLETYDETLRERARKSALSRLGPMRVELTKFLLAQSKHYVELNTNDIQNSGGETVDSPQQPMENDETFCCYCKCCEWNFWCWCCCYPKCCRWRCWRWCCCWLKCCEWRCWRLCCCCCRFKCSKENK